MMRNTWLLLLSFLLLLPLFEAETVQIRQVVKAGKSKFKCLFTITYKRDKVDLKNSRASCSPRKPKTKADSLESAITRVKTHRLLPPITISDFYMLRNIKLSAPSGVQFLVDMTLNPTRIVRASEKTKPTSHQCDRDCSTSSPKKCVFDFKLEMLKTDNDGRRADGRLRSVLAYNGQIPGPPIVICEGDTLVVNFVNKISGEMTNADGSTNTTNTTTLHFHGIREKGRPWSDGVPFVTQCPLLPGDPSFPYGFNTDVNGAPPGTYWYHSHVGSQRTNGAYGALIIKEKNTDGRFDVDNATNTLVLQEWCESFTNRTPVSILISGNGRVGEKKRSGGDEEILKHLQGKGGNFQCVPNEDYPGPNNFATDYTEYIVDEPGKSYRFRVIGAISQNVPLRLSIDEHKFTAIAADSLNIVPVSDLTNLWLAAGERYDIVVHTKSSATGTAFKIRVFGYSDINRKKGPLCSIAWLKYPGQTIDYSYVTDCDCSDFVQSSPGRTLNPVPNDYTEWEGSPANGKYFTKDLRAIEPQPTINHANLANLNTHYIEFVGSITFNNKRMKYPHVPFLLQDPNETGRCGSKCDPHWKTQNGLPYLYTIWSALGCSATASGKNYCECQHVIQQPWAPGYWAETVLINNNLKQTAAHPIHQHGGWYWVVGMGKYNHDISKTFIIEQDTNCTKQKDCLPRNFDSPPAKDTLQIPQNGYAIIRTPLDNAGTWIFHCHINYHVEIGMAMVLQIGELGEDPIQNQLTLLRPSVARSQVLYSPHPIYGQGWCTGPLKKNEACKTPPPSPDGGPATIIWQYPMEPVKRCVKPGNHVTFRFSSGHNVNVLSKNDWDKCNIKAGVKQVFPYAGVPVVTNPGNGPYVFKTAKPGTYYLACGVPSHCLYGHMKATIIVSNKCP